MHWLNAGDKNTKFFHNMIKARRNSNRIFTIRDGRENTRTIAPDIAEAFVEYYKNLLGRKCTSRIRVCSATVKEGPMVTAEQRRMLTAEFSIQEMKEALWDIAGDKAPGCPGSGCDTGPDRYGSQFFKDCWDTIKENLTAGVMEFFRAGKPLKVWNTTVLTLVPKSDHANTVGDYRSIACCNTIYKKVSKMLSNRLKLVLPDIISPNQSAYVAGRNIVQNILICQDLVRLYNRKQTTSSCLIKIDLKKAYDTVEWEFVEEMLHAMEFPQKYIK
ncbi:PREDICTED: uncharacterized protein LOC109209618 [Nicotiana attenuata]|uniref:uncharacterized protein LOC109209618 n=1 Tax=Nicotiana attenuata TaxID=49451 RepID=UPI000904B2DD|nr:PREDICTED: uncharacterized protein LOC109209618 [Nicotiana attenuata]